MPWFIKKIRDFLSDVNNIRKSFNEVFSRLDVVVEKLDKKQEVAVSQFGELIGNLAVLVSSAWSNTNKS